MGPLTRLVPRRLGPVALERARDEPVVLLQGPRSVGKSTLLSDLADEVGARVLDLDDLATRDVVSADPATFVPGPEPVFIDEYQHAPVVLDAIKAELNRDGRPGRFVLTGSARHESLPIAAQALTGRLHRLPVYPLSQGEIVGIDEQLLARILAGGAAELSGRSSRTEREDYIDCVVAGGFPMPLARKTAAGRSRWFDDYVRLTLERDVRELGRVELASALPKLLERMAGQTGQVLNLAKASQQLQISERTADSYLRLLESVFLLRRLPAWSTTLTSRSASRPKVGEAVARRRRGPSRAPLRQVHAPPEGWRCAADAHPWRRGMGSVSGDGLTRSPARQWSTAASNTGLKRHST